MKVLFVSESGSEHGSYLPVFADYFSAHPQFGVQPQLVAVGASESGAQESPSLLRRFGLDGHFSKSRRALSARAREEVAARKGTFEAILLNTQSMGLDLDLIGCPLHVCIDATYLQLGQSPWFSDLGAARRLANSLLSELIESERRLYAKAATLLPWSESAAKSLREDYGIPAEKIMRLPPSVEIGPARKNVWPTTPRGLFISDDFKRQGGDMLLETFRRSFGGRIELDVVTGEKLAPLPGIRVFRDIKEHTPEWRALWEEAHFFVFPSRLETFGLPLVRALAQGLPVISARAGAAAEILHDGAAGTLVDTLSVDGLGAAMESFLGDRRSMLAKAGVGRERVESEYDLRRNCARLATVLKGPIARTAAHPHPQTQA